MPALPVLAWFVTGSLPVSLAVLDLASPAAAFASGCALTIFCAVALPRPNALHLGAWGLGIGLALLHGAAPWLSYRRHLPGPVGYTEIEGIVTADHLPEHQELAWLRDTTSIPVAIHRLRVADNRPWQPCRGTVLMKRAEADLRYGQCIRVRGSLVEPWRAELPGGFDYRRMQRARGIRHLLYPESIHIVRDEAVGWRRLVRTWYGWRDTVLLRLLRGVHPAENRRILAAMTLGYRQGMDQADRDAYLRSGTIHLFAISGLHVGILYALILCMLQLTRVPFTWRYAVAPLILLLYVLATGAAAPAMRAWLMVTVWSTGRARRWPVVPTNTVLIAALLLLLINPFSLLQVGFQFSFVIVLCLIWGWQQAQGVRLGLHEKLAWVPSRLRAATWRSRFARWSLRAVLSMTAAWLGGLGLTAWYNQLFLPASILTNIGVFLLAWVIMALAVTKALVSLIFPWGLEWLLATSLSGVLSLLRGIARVAAAHGGVMAIAAPPLLLILCYYVLLAVFFRQSRNLRRSWALALALAVCVVAIIGRIDLPPSSSRATLLMPPGSVVPVIVLQPADRERHPFLINTGDRRFAWQLAAWLRHRGIGRIDQVIPLDTTRDFNSGLPDLLAEFPVARVRQLSTQRRSIDPILQAAWAHQTTCTLAVAPPLLAVDRLTIRPERIGLTRRAEIVWRDGPATTTINLTIDPHRHCLVRWRVTGTNAPRGTDASSGRRLPAATDAPSGRFHPATAGRLPAATSEAPWQEHCFLYSDRTRTLDLFP